MMQLEARIMKGMLSESFEGKGPPPKENIRRVNISKKEMHNAEWFMNDFMKELAAT